MNTGRIVYVRQNNNDKKEMTEIQRGNEMKKIQIKNETILVTLFLLTSVVPALATSNSNTCIGYVGCSQNPEVQKSVDQGDNVAAESLAEKDAQKNNEKMCNYFLKRAGVPPSMICDGHMGMWRHSND